MIPRLVAITPGDGRDLMSWLPVIAPYFDAIVLREPTLGQVAMQCLIYAVQDAGTLAIVHQKSARVFGDGLHVPDGAEVPSHSLVGVSCHSEASLELAFSRGATYAFLSPVWDPTSKAPTTAPLGLDRFCALAQGRPVLGLGGITPERCGVLAERGYGCALIGGVFLPDVGESLAAARAYKEASQKRKRSSS